MAILFCNRWRQINFFGLRIFIGCCLTTFCVVPFSWSPINKQQNKGKKKKKGGLPGGGLKAKMKDDLDDYGEFDGGYAQDYEDFM